MKLYEAIETIIQEFGRDILTNTKVINVFSDYKAFEESRTFKVIIKNLIAEGYMDQMMYVRDWATSQSHIINNFVAATSFNEANASYVIQSIAYGLGYTSTKPSYQPSAASRPFSLSNDRVSQGTSATQHTRNTTFPQGMNLDKTEGQFLKLSEATQRKYKEAAESYLESIIEFKSDIEKDLGVTIKPYAEYDGYGTSLRFEIDGKIKVHYDSSIDFHVLYYDKSGRIICKDTAYVGMNHSSFEVVESYINSSQFHKVGNIKRIVVYYEKN